MKKILSVVLFSISLLSYAQNEVSQKAEKPFIEVTGTAEKEIMPDVIYIMIILKDKTINNNSGTIEEQEIKLNSIIKKLNIESKNLMLSDVTTDLIIHKNKEKGVEEVKEYILKVSTASEVSNVFRELHNNEIKEAYISYTDHSDIIALRKKVRISAIKAAKDKADYY